MNSQKSEKISEWSPEKKWNPFNSYKLLAQVYVWRKIKENKPIPQPTLITVDPINTCNSKCVWCNAEFVLSKRSNVLSKKTLLDIADFLPKWKGHPKLEGGVEAVCVAGGGEPLLNPYLGEFINRLVENGVEVGVVTNGTEIDKFIEPLSKCTWVGVSVDAGTPETMEKLKRNSSFDKIIENIRELISYSEKHETMLGMDRSGYGVSYKYLLHPENISEILKAAKIAKDIGCKNFHMRPAGTPWHKLKKNNRKSVFNDGIVKEFSLQTEEARKLEDDNFGVYGITHKFDSEFNISNEFKSCHAIFMTGVFMPGDSGNPDEFTFGLCCDRRGDKKVELGTNLTDVRQVAKMWGSKKHWRIYHSIDVKKECPRCTYQPHNQIYEHVILNDSMTYKFI